MKWFLMAIWLNFFIGAIIWALIDDDRQYPYAWYKSADPTIAWLAQPLTLFCWPIVLFLEIKKVKYENKREI